MQQTILDVIKGLKDDRFKTHDMLYPVRPESEIHVPGFVSDDQMQLQHFNNQIRIMEAQEYILSILEKAFPVSYR